MRHYLSAKVLFIFHDQSFICHVDEVIIKALDLYQKQARNYRIQGKRLIILNADIHMRFLRNLPNVDPRTYIFTEIVDLVNSEECTIWVFASESFKANVAAFINEQKNDLNMQIYSPQTTGEILFVNDLQDLFDPETEEMFMFKGDEL